MNWIISFLKSSIGKKLLMALTGLFLCTFLLIHLIGNLQLYKHDGGLAFNTYAVFMTTNPLIKFTSYGLYATILFHAFWGLYLVFENKKARPVQYASYNGNANSKWTSRWMGVLGTIILAFIIFHMWGFWAQYKFGETPYTRYEKQLGKDTVTVVNMSVSDFPQKPTFKKVEFSNNGVDYVIIKDLYKVVADAFKNVWIVLLYILSMVALSFHLVHGFSSAFQSLGINNSKYNGLIKFVGFGLFGVLVPILFAAMPIYFLLFQK